jgi:hypothetical protein
MRCARIPHVIDLSTVFVDKSVETACTTVHNLLMIAELAHTPWISSGYSYTSCASKLRLYNAIKTVYSHIHSAYDCYCFLYYCVILLFIHTMVVRHDPYDYALSLQVVDNRWTMWMNEDTAEHQRTWYTITR